MPSPSVAIIAYSTLENDNSVAADVCRRYVDLIVGTADANGLMEDHDKTIVIRPPDFGYHCYSYKVGLFEAVRRYPQLRPLILLSSHIRVLGRCRFEAVLARARGLLEQHDVVGASASHQCLWHILSYFIAIGERTLRSDWFQEVVPAGKLTQQQIRCDQRI